MKVEVLTVDQVQLKWWQWWSNWVDVCVFDYGSDGFLLQMRISRRNAKDFKCREFKGRFSLACPSANTVGNLTQMKAPNDQ